jgi:hypothetical protein
VIIKSPKGIVLGDGIRTNQSFSKYVLLKPSGRVEMEKQLEIE